MAGEHGKRSAEKHRADEPARKRSQSTTWKEFITSHMAVLAGADFFTVEVLTWLGLRTYYVLFLIHFAEQTCERRRNDTPPDSSVDGADGPQRNTRRVTVSFPDQRSAARSGHEVLCFVPLSAEFRRSTAADASSPESKPKCVRGTLGAIRGVKNKESTANLFRAKKGSVAYFDTTAAPHEYVDYTRTYGTTAPVLDPTGKCDSISQK